MYYNGFWLSVKAQRRGPTINILKRERQIQILSALVEGNSIRSVERMTGVHRDTIMRLLLRTGEKCAAIMDDKMHKIDCNLLQIDEIWTYVRKKQRNVTQADFDVHPEWGDNYVFVAIDAETKLVPAFDIGKRDGDTGMRFMRLLRQRLNGNRVQITTDAFNVYPFVIGNTFGLDAHYAQLQKLYHESPAGRGRYSPPRIVRTEKEVFWGSPRRSKISTSYVERQNLTMRMQMRRFTRLTNGFSKKLDNLIAALNLHFTWYNFCRVHRTLKTTPAVKAGLASHVWQMEELLTN